MKAMLVARGKQRPKDSNSLDWRPDGSFVLRTIRSHLGSCNRGGSRKSRFRQRRGGRSGRSSRTASLPIVAGYCAFQAHRHDVSPA